MIAAPADDLLIGPLGSDRRLPPGVAPVGELVRGPDQAVGPLLVGAKEPVRPVEPLSVRGQVSLTGEGPNAGQLLVGSLAGRRRPPGISLGGLCGDSGGGDGANQCVPGGQKGRGARQGPSQVVQSPSFGDNRLQLVAKQPQSGCQIVQPAIEVGQEPPAPLLARRRPDELGVGLGKSPLERAQLVAAIGEDGDGGVLKGDRGQDGGDLAGIEATARRRVGGEHLDERGSRAGLGGTQPCVELIPAVADPASRSPDASIAASSPARSTAGTESAKSQLA